MRKLLETIALAKELFKMGFLLSRMEARYPTTDTNYVHGRWNSDKSRMYILHNGRLYSKVAADISPLEWFPDFVSFLHERNSLFTCVPKSIIETD